MNEESQGTPLNKPLSELTPDEFVGIDWRTVERKLKDDYVCRKVSEGNITPEEATRAYEEMRIRMDEILFYKWDPIHLSDSNWPRDEYAFYVAGAMKFALENEDWRPLADYLTWVSTRMIEMTEDRERDEAVAELLHAVAHDILLIVGKDVFEVD